MAINMKPIRNSVKAIIIENSKILLNKCDFNDGKTAYLFSGGGQEIGETFVEALKRECLEELGAQVSVGELVWVREYIGKNHLFAESESDMHQVEYYFLCQLHEQLPQPTNPDSHQIGTEWVSVARLHQFPLYPKLLIPQLQRYEQGLQTTIYLGDIN